MIDPNAEHYFVQRSPDGIETIVRLDIERMQVHQSSRFDRPRFSMTGWFDGGGFLQRQQMELPPELEA